MNELKLWGQPLIDDDKIAEHVKQAYKPTTYSPELEREIEWTVALERDIAGLAEIASKLLEAIEKAGVFDE